MESSISSKSLITGNVSTDESRNEIRQSPGAPRLPANATILSFHAFMPSANSLSRETHKSWAKPLGVRELAPAFVPSSHPNVCLYPNKVANESVEAGLQPVLPRLLP